jgi:hypothetical protein
MRTDMLNLSPRWAKILLGQPESGMDCQIATVILKDGRQFPNSTIVGGCITRVGENSEVPFQEAEIESIIVDHGK